MACTFVPSPSPALALLGRHCRLAHPSTARRRQPSTRASAAAKTRPVGGDAHRGEPPAATSSHPAATAPPPGAGDAAGESAPLRRFARMSARLSRPALLRAAVAVAVSVSCALATPVLLGRTLNALVLASQAPGREAAASFLRSLLSVFLLFAVECASGMVYVRNMTAVVDRGVMRLRGDTFRAVAVGCDAGFFDSVSPADITNAVGNDSARVRDIFWQCLQTDRGVRAVFEASLGIVVVMFISMRIAAIYWVCIPLVAVVSARSGLQMAALLGEEAVARNAATGVARESLSAWKTVLSFGAGERELARYQSCLVGVDKSVSSRLRPRKALNDFIARFGIIFLLCAVLSIGGGSVALGVLPFERYIACQQFVWKLTFSTQGVIYTGADLAEAASALRRVYSVSDRADEASQRLLEKSASRHGTRRAQLMEPPPVAEGAVRGQLSLRNVTFAYPLRPDSPVFNGLDLEIDAGKTTALVGMSGSGKSTVHALIARFYEPQGGTVLLDGVDISTIDRDWYAEKIGIVSQAPVVFAGTVRDAIAYGAPDRKQPVAQGLVERAARLANAHDFIMALPDGYDADVGVGGSAFSGGQLQRIAIARAIVRDADVWLLDEATSALDSHSETAVQQALDRLTEGKTALIVAHRLSTIRNADKVVVLGAAGRVLEHGSYKELVRRPGGAFARLIETQTETFMSE